MRNDIDLTSFSFGFICGMAFIFAATTSPWSIASKANNAIIECQKELPRNQKCEVFAMPQEPR